METTITDSDSPVRGIYTRQPDNPAVIVADGYGVKIHVARGHLVIEDGIGDTRRVRRIPRVDGSMPAQRSTAPGRVARLAILSDTGFITLEAVRWCADLGISVTQVDRNGRVLFSSPGQEGDARLRASQVLASGTPQATEIVRSLTAGKMTGQAQVMRDVFSDEKTASYIENLIARLPLMNDVKEIGGQEGSAALAYWRGWKDHVFVPFAPTELKYVPSHWYSFQTRTSKRNPLAQGKNATDPVNAMLNYAYALCANEARYAAHIIGLDPAFGFGHGPNRGIDTLVYDLIEVLRPEADRVVLSLLDTGSGVPYSDGKPAYFRALWFVETRDSACRLTAPLTHMIAERIPGAVGRLAGTHAHLIATELASTARYNLRTSSYVLNASPARLDTVRKHVVSADLMPVDVLSDSAWEAVRVMIPAEPVAQHHKFKRSDTRAVLAGIICHETTGRSWKNLPAGFGVVGETCRRRLLEWQELGVWETIYKTVRESA